MLMRRKNTSVGLFAATCTETIKEEGRQRAQLAGSLPLTGLALGQLGRQKTHSPPRQVRTRSRVPMVALRVQFKFSALCS